MHRLAFAIALLLAANAPLQARGTAPLGQETRTDRASRVVGAWEGFYHCGQGRTGLRLTLTEGPDETIEGEFAFFAEPGNPGVPSGRFRLEGVAQPSGEFTVRGTEWVDQPEGYRVVGLEGAADAGGARLTGKVLDPGCSTFEVTRAPGTASQGAKATAAPK